MNKYNILDSWDVAHRHGHAAFRLLKLGYDDEINYKTVNDWLRSIPQDSSEYGQAEYLGKVIEQKTHLKNMYSMYSTSVIMLQTMMEAIINHVLENVLNSGDRFPKGKLDLLKNSSGESNNKKDKIKNIFRNKWGHSLIALGKSTNNFDIYDKEIYLKFRNVLIHPSENALNNLDDLCFKNLYFGFKNGWEAFGDLYDGLGTPHDQSSWKIMCEVHGIPIQNST